MFILCNLEVCVLCIGIGVVGVRKMFVVCFKDVFDVECRMWEVEVMKFMVVRQVESYVLFVVLIGGFYFIIELLCVQMCYGVIMLFFMLEFGIDCMVLENEILWIIWILIGSSYMIMMVDINVYLVVNVSDEF